MQCQNLYKSSSKQTIQTICILIHMISFNFVLIIKKSDALHEHILHKIGVLFGLNSKTMHSKIVKVKNVSIPTIGYAETMINKPQNTVFVGINNFGKINPASPINIALSDYDGTVYIFGLPGTNIDWIEIICLFCN